MLWAKVLLFALLTISFIAFFWQIKRNKVLENTFLGAYDALDGAAMERARKAKRNILLQEDDERSKTFLEKFIEKPERKFTYSGLGRIFPGLTIELWIILILFSTAALYFILFTLSKSLFLSLMISFGYLLGIEILETIMAFRNYRIVGDNLIKFLNMLGNFSITRGEVTGVFHEISRFLPEPLSSVLEECYYDAQTSGDTSSALYAMAAKMEHPKFQEIVTNIEVCTHYTANFKVVVDSCRKSILDEQRASMQRKSAAKSVTVNMLIISILLVVALFLVGQMIETSIWQILFHTVVGRGALFIIAVCYIVFGWKVITAER